MAKRSLTIAGHRTSISIEDDFWDALVAIARERATPLATVVAGIDRGRRPDTNLSSAIRSYVLAWHREPPPPVS